MFSSIPELEPTVTQHALLKDLYALIEKKVDVDDSKRNAAIGRLINSPKLTNQKNEINELANTSSDAKTKITALGKILLVIDRSLFIQLNFKIKAYLSDDLYGSTEAKDQNTYVLRYYKKILGHRIQQLEKISTLAQLDGFTFSDKHLYASKIQEMFSSAFRMMENYPFEDGKLGLENQTVNISLMDLLNKMSGAFASWKTKNDIQHSSKSSFKWRGATVGATLPTIVVAIIVIAWSLNPLVGAGLALLSLLGGGAIGCAIENNCCCGRDDSIQNHGSKTESSPNSKGNPHPNLSKMAAQSARQALISDAQVLPSALQQGAQIAKESKHNTQNTASRYYDGEWQKRAVTAHRSPRSFT